MIWALLGPMDCADAAFEFAPTGQERADTFEDPANTGRAAALPGNILTPRPLCFNLLIYI